MNGLLIALVTVLHLIPHPFGVSPVGATALYAGAYASPRFAWAVPLLPLSLAALVFGFYDPVVMLFVFGGFALSTLVGRWLLGRRRSLPRYGTAVAIGATVFFLVSNFSVWLVGMYPSTVAGLVECYVNGLPYLLTAMLADGVYSFMIFGTHKLIEKQARQRAYA